MSPLREQEHKRKSADCWYMWGASILSWKFRGRYAPHRPRYRSSGYHGCLECLNVCLLTPPRCHVNLLADSSRFSGPGTKRVLEYKKRVAFATLSSDRVRRMQTKDVSASSC